jgi:hypothetical protein
MIWRKTLISLIVFALLVGLYTGDRWLSERRRAAKEVSERAFPLDWMHANEFTLVTPNEIITVKREYGDRWAMTQPIRALADNNEVQAIVGNLVPAVRYGEFKMDDTTKLEDYGLDAPAFKLTIKTSDAPQGLTLLVGKQAAESGKFYAKIESEDKVFSINEYVKDKLNKKPFDFRDRRALPINVNDVRRVALTRQVKMPIEIKSVEDGTTRTTSGFQTREPEKVVLAKTDSGEWRIEQPLPWKGDPNEIENLLRKIITEKVASFVDTPTTGTIYGFDKPQVDLQIQQSLRAGDGGTTMTTQTQTLSLLVGDRESSPSKDYYARRGDGSLVTIGQPLFEALTVKAAKLRDKQLFTMAAGDVAHFGIEGLHGAVKVNKNDQGRWVFADDAATSVDQQAVANALSTLVGLRAKDFETDEPRDLAEYKLDKPLSRLTIADKDNKKVEGLDIGDLTTRNGEGVLFGKMRDSTSVILLDFMKPKDFALTKDQLVDKSLFAFEPGAVTRVEARRAGTTFTLTREGEAWRLRRGKDKEARRVADFLADDLVRGAREMKYSDVYKGKLTEKEMGLTSPTFEVVLYGKDNAEVARVIRGSEKGERFYTRIRAGGTIYGIEKSQFRTLEPAIDNLLKEE